MQTQRESSAVIGGVFLTLKGARQIIQQIIEANEGPSVDLMARLALVAAGIEYGLDTLQAFLSPAPTTDGPGQPGDTPEQAGLLDLLGQGFDEQDVRLSLLGQKFEG